MGGIKLLQMTQQHDVIAFFLNFEECYTLLIDPHRSGVFVCCNVLSPQLTFKSHASCMS